MSELIEVDTYDISHSRNIKKTKLEKQITVRIYFIKNMNIEIKVIHKTGSSINEYVPIIKIVETDKPTIFKINKNIVLEKIKISKDWVNECIEYNNLKKKLKDKKLKLFFKSPTQKTIDDLVTEEFNAGFESFTSKDYTDGIKHFKECLKLLKNEIVQEIYINAIYNIACCYSLLDNFEKTIKWLTKAVNTGYCNWCETIKDNDFKKIINNEQMVEIIKQMIKKNPYNHEAKIDNDIETYLELHNINYLEVNMFINIFEDIINKIYD